MSNETAPVHRADDPLALCRACGLRPGTAVRGLCGSCRKRPEVLAMFPPRQPRKAHAPRTCAHCRRRPPNRPRGLCWTCYYSPGVRSKHPSSVRQGVADRTGGLPLPEPTQAWPGTEEKIRVLMARAAAGEALWHPDDPAETPLPPREARVCGYRVDRAVRLSLHEERRRDSMTLLHHGGNV